MNQKTATSLLTEKHHQPGILYPANIFQKWKHYKDFFRQALRNHSQPTKTTRNVKRNTSGRRKIIPHKSLDLYKSTKDDTCETVTFFLLLQKSLNLTLKVIVDCLRQTNNVRWDFCVCRSEMPGSSSTKAGRGKWKASGVLILPEGRLRQVKDMRYTPKATINNTEQKHS